MKESAILTIRMDEETSKPGSVTYIAASSVGARTSQQDSLYIGEKEGAILAVICDGMGGMNGGERASELAVQMLTQEFYTRDISNVPAFFREMAVKMDEAVYSLKDGERLMGAGTTIVSVIVDQSGLYWLSVGDSKIYLCRRGELLCPVAAHNYRLILDQMLADGRISQEKYDSEGPKAEALISFLGLGGISRMEINQNPFLPEPGDRILLCSDGLYKSLTEQEILNILQLPMSAEVKIKMLLDRALEKGGARQDNTSIILLQT